MRQEKKLKNVKILATFCLKRGPTWTRIRNYKYLWVFTFKKTQYKR